MGTAVIVVICVAAVGLLIFELDDANRRSAAYREAAIHFAKRAGHEDPVLVVEAAYQASYDPPAGPSKTQ